jgi:hypothetical protein
MDKPAMFILYQPALRQSSRHGLKMYLQYRQLIAAVPPSAHHGSPLTSLDGDASRLNQ